MQKHPEAKASRCQLGKSWAWVICQFYLVQARVMSRAFIALGFKVSSLA